MRHGIAVEGCEIVAVDLAPAMVSRCRALVEKDGGTVPVSVLESDIRDVEIANASMVVMNYTLQFLPVADREVTIRDIHDGLSAGGVFVLSEKVAHADPEMDELLIELYHDFKRDNDYSDLEIARKRTALENVLIPETVDDHLARLGRAGFSHCDVWMKHLNFVSILAVR
jgi:tRNA (cmo5U34)-methyltransferase